MSSRILVALLLILLGTSLVGCTNPKATKREKHLKLVAKSQNKYERLAQGHDVDGEKASEAQSWLESTRTDNVLTKTNRKQTLGFVNALYNAGAQKVFCVYVTKDVNFRANLCHSLLVQLPKDEKDRKGVLRAFAKIEKEFWGESAVKAKAEDKDYLLLEFDP